MQHRRDNSYIWWYTGDQRQRRFGRVTIYVIAYTYEAIAVVRAFERVEEVQELDIVMVRGGLIGRIESSDKRGKVVYLTSNSSREQDSFDE